LQYLLKYSNNQNNSENAKQIKVLCACFGLGAAAHRLVGWVCWAMAEKASQAPHIAQLGAACRDLAMAARRCGCSGEGTLSAMGGQAMKTTWRRITGRLDFMVSRCEKGAATTRGKGGLTEHVLQQRRRGLRRQEARPAPSSKDLRGLASAGFTTKASSAQQ
jgi:hypothetical protein